VASNSTSVFYATFHACEKSVPLIAEYAAAAPIAVMTAAIAAPAITWLSEAVETYCMVEQPLADPAEGFGGTLDLYFKTKAGEYLLADVKTQKTKKDKKIETYPEWCWQLAAQKHLVKRTGGQVTHCINIVLSSTEPGRMEFKTWSDDDIAHGLKVFYALRDVFYLSRKYDYTGAEKIK